MVALHHHHDDMSEPTGVMKSSLGESIAITITDLSPRSSSSCCRQHKRRRRRRRPLPSSLIVCSLLQGMIVYSSYWGGNPIVVVEARATMLTTAFKVNTQHTTSSSYRQQYQVLLEAAFKVRGGAAAAGSSGDDFFFNDAELDDYIEFLLASVEGDVSDSENPLFKKEFQRVTAATTTTLLDDGEDEIEQEEEETTLVATEDMMFIDDEQEEDDSILETIPASRIIQEEDGDDQEDAIPTTLAFGQEEESLASDQVVQEQLVQEDDSSQQQQQQVVVVNEEKRMGEVSIHQESGEQQQLQPQVEMIAVEEQLQPAAAVHTVVPQQHQDSIMDEDEKQELDDMIDDLVAQVDDDDEDTEEEDSSTKEEATMDMFQRLLDHYEQEDNKEEEEEEQAAATVAVPLEHQPQVMKTSMEDFFLGPSAVEEVPLSSTIDEVKSLLLQVQQVESVGHATAQDDKEEEEEAVPLEPQVMKNSVEDVFVSPSAVEEAPSTIAEAESSLLQVQVESSSSVDTTATTPDEVSATQEPLPQDSEVTPTFMGKVYNSFFGEVTDSSNGPKEQELAVLTPEALEEQLQLRLLEQANAAAIAASEAVLAKVQQDIAALESTTPDHEELAFQDEETAKTGEFLGRLEADVIPIAVTEFTVNTKTSVLQEAALLDQANAAAIAASEAVWPNANPTKTEETPPHQANAAAIAASEAVWPNANPTTTEETPPQAEIIDSEEQGEIQVHSAATASLATSVGTGAEGSYLRRAWGGMCDIANKKRGEDLLFISKAGKSTIESESTEPTTAAVTSVLDTDEVLDTSINEEEEEHMFDIETEVELVEDVDEGVSLSEDSDATESPLTGDNVSVQDQTSSEEDEEASSEVSGSYGRMWGSIAGAFGKKNDKPSIAATDDLSCEAENGSVDTRSGVANDGHLDGDAADFDVDDGVEETESAEPTSAAVSSIVDTATVLETSIDEEEEHLFDIETEVELVEDMDEGVSLSGDLDATESPFTGDNVSVQDQTPSNEDEGASSEASGSYSRMWGSIAGAFGKKNGEDTSEVTETIDLDEDSTLIETEREVEIIDNSEPNVTLAADVTTDSDGYELEYDDDGLDRAYLEIEAKADDQEYEPIVDEQIQFQLNDAEPNEACDSGMGLAEDQQETSILDESEPEECDEDGSYDPEVPEIAIESEESIGEVMEGSTFDESLAEDVFDGTLRAHGVPDLAREPRHSRQKKKKKKPVSSLQHQDDSDVSDSESYNFFYRLLLAKGLEQWLMTLILISEWCRIYLSPLAEIPGWLVRRQPDSILGYDKLLSKVMRARGGGVEDYGVDEAFSDTNTIDGVDSSPVVLGADKSTETADNSAGPKSGKKRRTKDAAPDTTSDSSKSGTAEDHEDTELDDLEAKTVSSNATISQGAPAVPRVRPNKLYRFLLGQGHVGHILVMETILTVEWTRAYFPLLFGVLDYLSGRIFPKNRNWEDEEDHNVASQTTGFVTTDGSTVRGGRKRKAQTRKDDEKALYQLKRVGNVNQAKYRFLSEEFMKRHKLGWYAKNSPEAGLTAQLMSEPISELQEEESDTEWVLQALTGDDVPASRTPSVDTAVGLSVGTSGPAVSVGIEFGFGTKRKKKRRTSVSEAVKKVAPRKRKSSGPRTSDRDSGVMGRLRAAGANSIVGRSLLGAYPGDAPPPNEAACASGLIDLARKYGYGDWSHDEEDEGYGYGALSDDDEPDTRRRKRKSSSVKSSKTKKKRRRKPSSIGLEFDLRPRSSESALRSRARTTLTERTTQKEKTPFDPSPILDQPRQSTLGGDRERLTQPATERLREAQDILSGNGRLRQSLDHLKKERTSHSSQDSKSRSTGAVLPATERLKVASSDKAKNSDMLRQSLEHLTKERLSTKDSKRKSTIGAVLPATERLKNSREKTNGSDKVRQSLDHLKKERTSQSTKDSKSISTSDDESKDGK